MNAIHISDFPRHTGETATVRGWIANRRSSGKIHFLVVRDGTGFLQVVIGRIGRAHGIRGELNVDIRTDEPDRRFARGSSVICGDRVLTVASARHHSGRLVVAFREIADRTAAALPLPPRNSLQNS